MARCNKTAYAILGLISKQPASGYDIKKKLASMSKWYWSESNAQIYPILKRMEAQGCLSSELDTSSGARQRRIYQITPDGMKKLIAWLQQPVEPPTHRDEFFLKLNLAQHLTQDEMIKHLTQFQQRICDELNHIKHIQELIQQTHQDRPDYNYLTLSYQYALSVWQAKADWCQQSLDSLGA